MPDAIQFDAEAAMRPLKAFQRRTVDYVFRRLYLDPDCTRHFLVADEVGLGKTMVARGVIDCAYESTINCSTVIPEMNVFSLPFFVNTFRSILPSSSVRPFPSRCASSAICSWKIRNP